MYSYGNIDVFKSFITYFITHETNEQVSSYESVKFEEKRKRQNSEISHIDRTTLEPRIYIRETKTYSFYKYVEHIMFKVT